MPAFLVGATRWFVLTFGTVSTLNGYDLATGLGTPNGPEFVETPPAAAIRRRTLTEFLYTLS